MMFGLTPLVLHFYKGLMISFTERYFLSTLGGVSAEMLLDNYSFGFMNSGIGQVQEFAYSVTGILQEGT